MSLDGSAGAGERVRARDNPFRVSRLEALAWRPGPGGWPGLLEVLAAHGGRGQVVGPKGSGKTTLMVELAERLRRRGLDGRGLEVLAFRSRDGRLSPPWSAVAAAGPESAVLVDGLEALPWFGRWRLLLAARRAAVLVVTAHRRLALPGLPVVRRRAVDAGLARELVVELVGEEEAPTEPALGRLLERHDGNLREVFGELYRRWARGEGSPGRSADRRDGEDDR